MRLEIGKQTSKKYSLIKTKEKNIRNVLDVQILISIQV